ncbi:hypothetical protein LCGC14_0275200 [marine sediment metagenome]|uniref:Uncharacterized protein n=1 Tax=marine sediment metagenome TaxID=412755 RepID=A0A0F9TXE8_9ZZZZ
MASRKDLYDFHFLSPGTDVTIKLGTEEAQGWGEKWAEALEQATLIELVPRKHAQHMPKVVVLLPGEKRWVYYLKTQGVIMGAKGSRVRHELATYNIGWTRGDHSEVITVYPDGMVMMQTGITLDRSQRDGSVR